MQMDIQLRPDSEGNVLLFSPTQHTHPYCSWGFYGSKPEPDDPTCTVFLSAFEAGYLQSIGRLAAIPPVTLQACQADAGRYAVYTTLRQNGWIVRPGTQFGGDFLAYRGAPGEGHAPYVVLVYPEHGLPMCVLAGLVRAAGSAKKQMVLAMPDGTMQVMSRWIPEQERMK